MRRLSPSELLLFAAICTCFSFLFSLLLFSGSYRFSILLALASIYLCLRGLFQAKRTLTPFLIITVDLLLILLMFV